MKIIVTGSLGNVGKPLTQILVKQGHAVTVISSDPKKCAAIEALGAMAAIGSIADVPFLIATFTGADAVYAMIPLPYTDPEPSIYLRRMAANYAEALNATAVKRVVVMSGWAADLVPGENVEDVFDGLTGAAITILRPASFYSNAVAEELLLRPEHATIRYVGSEEMTCNEAAKILGTAVGKPWLRWVLLSDKQMLQGLKMARLPEKLCEMLVRMQATMHSGKTLENFHRNHPKMGKVKLADFAKEFASVYHKQ